jgi:uncharacterized protein (TIGR00255 family)
MTGYGRAAKAATAGTVSVELRSTNHRYLEVDSRLPNGLTALQGRLTELIRGRLRRGRVEASVSVQWDRADGRRVVFDQELLLTISEDRAPLDRLQEPIVSATGAALEELVRARRREGAKLVRDIRKQLRTIEQQARLIKRRMPKAFEEQRKRLRQRLKELLGSGTSVSSSQLEQAAALAKEADINEELVRLESHLGYVRQALAKGELVGKRLDFIAQELMRETNTMGAKVNDPDAAQHVVEIKGCIEKIREQVQNLE